MAEQKTAQHVFIEGENLEVLRVLQKSYFGRVKMIYIDPPYNTGNDSFVYPDDYTERLSDYKKRTGLADENGFINKQDLWRKNSKESGQYHSVWLSMMYPRLYLARNLLDVDYGLIFISIGNDEVENLRLLCNEIFGEENFIADLIWRNGRTAAAHFTLEHEHILCFSRNKEKLDFFKFNGDETVSDRTIKKAGEKNPYSEISFLKGIRFDCEDKVFPTEFGVAEKVFITKGTFECLDGKLANNVTIKAGWAMKDMIESWLSGEDVIDQKGQKVTSFFFKNNGVLQYEKEKGTIHPKSIIENISTKKGTSDFKKLFKDDLFSYPKPTELVKSLAQYTSTENDIILDFFAGSGTTAQAVMELNLEDGGNRQCICVQMPEVLDETSEAHKAGYRTIADITRARITKVIAKLKAEKPMLTQNLACANFTLTPSHFKVWQPDVLGDAAIMQQLELHQQAEHPASLQQNMLTELLLKMGLGLVGVEAKASLISVADTEIYAVSLPESGLLWLCFNPYKTALKAEIVKAKPQQIVFLNSCFIGSNADEQLTNLELELKQQHIKLTVI